MTNQVIPAEAVEAAHAAICEQSLEDCLDPDWRGKCVKAVEAAAPYMQRESREMAAIARERKRKLEAVVSIATRLGTSMQGDDRELAEELYAAMGLT